MNEDVLIEKWNALAEAKDAFIEELDQFSADQVGVSPDGGWSALQVLEHIMFSETGTLGYMKKKTSSGWEGLERPTPETIAAGEALIARLVSPDKYKAPSVLPEPTGGRDLTEMLEQWDELRGDFEQFIFDLDEEYYDRLVFRQPIAGPLDLFQTVDFLRFHIEHHIYQLHRIRAAVQA